MWFVQCKTFRWFPHSSSWSFLLSGFISNKGLQRHYWCWFTNRFSKSYFWKHEEELIYFVFLIRLRKLFTKVLNYFALWCGALVFNRESLSKATCFSCKMCAYNVSNEPPAYTFTQDQNEGSSWTFVFAIDWHVYYSPPASLARPCRTYGFRTSSTKNVNVMGSCKTSS